MLEKLDQRVKKLKIGDIALIKWSVFFGTVIMVKLFPRLAQISYPVLITLLVICAIKPMYKFWVKQ